ncbi:MAG: cytochrome c peroxidase [Bdellovibrionota bacterium]
MRLQRIYLSAFILLLVACNNSGSNTITETDAKLRTLISEQNLTGDPSLEREIPLIESPEAQLGMKLFFTKALGGDRDTACVSCHHPALGGGDNFALPMGVGAVDTDVLGPGRELASHAGPNVPRNAPSTFNISLWDQVLFWDGRVESLGKTPNANGADGAGVRTPDSSFGEADPLAEDLTSAQVRFPVTSNAEMRGESFVHGGSNEDVRTALALRLSENPAWKSEFEKVYGNDTISYQKVASAIAKYENSQTFVDTPWKEYVGGNDAAISLAAKRGALAFFTSRENGGAGCADCHGGDFFTDEKFHAIAIPQIGEGKGDGPHGDDDFGRFRETGVASDMYAFRTPTLLNVEVTGPYGHSGAYKTLEEIVLHHLNAEEAISKFDMNNMDEGIIGDNWEENTQRALATVKSYRELGAATIYDVAYDELMVLNIVEFLKSLTDPCVKDRQCLNPWIPEASSDLETFTATNPSNRPL